MKKSLLAMILLVASRLCDAAGWTQLMSVTSANTENDDYVFIYTSDATVYSPGCTAGSFMFSSSSTDAQRARAWATILTALATGQKIYLWVFRWLQPLEYPRRDDSEAELSVEPPAFHPRNELGLPDLRARS
jgi:hypothetical protein